MMDIHRDSHHCWMYGIDRIAWHSMLIVPIVYVQNNITSNNVSMFVWHVSSCGELYWFGQALDFRHLQPIMDWLVFTTMTQRLQLFRYVISHIVQVSSHMHHIHA